MVMKEVAHPRGLSQREVAARRAGGQVNRMPRQTSRTYSQILRENVFTSVNNIMFVLSLALLFLGQISDAIISTGVVFFNVLVSVAQELRAKRTLDRIALLTRPRATVVREGQEQEIDPDDIVLDDVLLVHAGDQIVVDGPLLAGSLEADESLLTGESDRVLKGIGETLYSGSFCVSGSAYYRAEKIGSASVASQLTIKARTFRRVYTPLQQEINLIIRALLLVAMFFELLLFISTFINYVPVVESVKMAVVTIGIVPKGLFLATSVAYAVGALNMLGKGALVQQANAVESLSNVDILCLDKTGTLTANALVVESLYPFAIAEQELRRLLANFIAASTTRNATSEAIAAACGPSAATWHAREEVPFSSERKWSALAVDAGQDTGVYVLGAPDVLQLHGQQAESAAWIEEKTRQGMRVVLFARSHEDISLFDDQQTPRLPDRLVPTGMISLRDQLRPETRETLANFAKTGVRLKIISGDHPDTVAALARQIDFDTGDSAVAGQDIERMDDAQLAEAAEQHTIFGRVTPRQKERIVRALHTRSHYVAMIGDGVNDVAALKQADLGIAMESGSQAARGVSDIVLLKDTFAALPPAFKEGQRIRNGMHSILKLFMTRVLYVTLLLVATTVVEGFPFVPKQNAILTFFTEGVPTIALATWAYPSIVPRGNLSRSLLRFVLPAAITISLAGLAVYLGELLAIAQPWTTAGVQNSDITLQRTLPAAQSALTTFSVFCGLLLIPFVVPPGQFWAGATPLSGDWRPTLLALALLIGYCLMLAISPLRSFFELAQLSVIDYLLIGGAALAWAFIQRWVWRARLLERFLQVEWD